MSAMRTSSGGTNPPKGVVLPKGGDGAPNPRYVDLLAEDKPIAGQKFCCISFVSPEKLLKNRDVFLFNEFVKHWGIAKPMEKYNQFLNFIAYKYSVDFDKLAADLKDFVADQSSTLNETTIGDDYKTFLDSKEEELTSTFETANEFRTSTRGIKVRGSFPSQEEAEMRSKLLRESDPDHDIFVGPVGMWMPWHPEAYKTGRVEYMEAELNQLMSEKQQNEAKAKEDFDGRIRDAREKAIKDNIEKAKASGNKLTQGLDADGNLVGVANASTVETALSGGGGGGDAISTADIRRELFEGENVVMEKDGDHGLSLLGNTIISSKPPGDDGGK